jgi:alkylhydroperoxidase family enzyme
MPRLADYATGSDPERDRVARLIGERRAGGRLINLDLALLHSAPFAEAWSHFLGAVRGRLGLSGFHRELAVCSVAVLNGADYELFQHAPHFLGAGGSPDQLAALADVEKAAADARLFDAPARAVLRFTLESTRDVAVSDAAFQALRDCFLGDQAIVEVAGVVATYNMVSRFLVALKVEIEPAPADTDVATS